MSREPERSNQLALEAMSTCASQLPDDVLSASVINGLATVTVPRDYAHRLLELLRERGFDFLVDITAHDTLRLEDPGPERFCLHWLVHSLDQDARVHVRSWIPEADPRVDTVSDLWSCAEWGERECFDMYGIEFDAHPDLRRILMPEDFDAFPLRKDYPLEGRGEREAFPVVTRDKA